MDRRTFLRATGLVGAPIVAGCSGSDDGSGGSSPNPTPRTTPADTETVTPSGSLCETVDGTTFESVEKQAGGLGPGTVAEVHWQVSFDHGEYQYSHTDVLESGSYACSIEDGIATIEGSVSGTDRTYEGTYDPESGELVWDGVRYQPVGD